MKKQEAMERYIKHGITSQRSVKRLMLWKNGMSIKQFATALGVTTTWAWQFAKRFGLEFTQRSWHRTNSRSEGIKLILKKTWDEDKTVRENAIALGYSYSRASYYCRKYNLKAKWKRKGQYTLNRLQKVQDYLDKGISQADIARVMGLSRERVRQLVNEYKIEAKK